LLKIAKADLLVGFFVSEQKTAVILIWQIFAAESKSEAKIV
jgi:hypothetical protein